MCHSRTKCKFSIFLSILLGVFEAQVTVDRSRAVILQFCYDNGLVDRGGEKSVIPALQLTHSGTGVKETQNTKVLWEQFNGRQPAQFVIKFVRKCVSLSNEM